MSRLRSICLALFPFALVALWTAFFFDTSVHLVRSVVFGLAALLLALNRDRIGFAPYRPAVAAFLAFGAVVLASTLVNQSGLNGLKLYADWCVLLFTGAVATALIGERLFTTFLTLPILLAVGYWAALAGDAVAPALTASFHQGETRLRLFTHNSAALAMIVGACVLFVLHCLARAKTRRAQAGHLALTASLLALLYATNGRGGMLALAVALPVNLAFVYRRVAAAALIAALVATTVFFAFKFMPDSDRMDRIRAGMAHLAEDPTVMERRKVWQVALAAIEAKPLLGHGLRSFPGVYEKFQAERVEELRRQGFESLDLVYYHAHNMILHLLTETGALGTAAFLAFYGLILLRARQAGGFGLFYASFLTFYFLWCLLEAGLHRKLDSILLFLFAGPFLFAPASSPKTEKP